MPRVTRSRDDPASQGLLESMGPPVPMDYAPETGWQPRMQVSYEAMRCFTGDHGPPRHLARTLVGGVMKFDLEDDTRVVYEVTDWDAEHGVFTLEWPD